MIKAVIFDFDGIIVNSEPLWEKAEARVLKTVGIELDPEVHRKTAGLDTQDTINYMYRLYRWTDKSTFQVYKEIMEEMQLLLDNEVDIMDGFLDVLQFFVDARLPLAVASASPLKLITTGLKKFHLFDYFKIVNSSENAEAGKPHPVLFLNTAKKLGINAEDCLVLEDSFNGAIAAKAARMKLLVVPEKFNAKSTRFDFADLKLTSLKDFKKSHFEHLNSLI